MLIQAVVIEGLSYGQVAAHYGVSKSLIHRLHHRWLAEGDLVFRARSHARIEIIILIHNHDATIISLDGTVLGDYMINPKQSYQSKRKTGEPPQPRVHPFTMS